MSRRGQVLVAILMCATSHSARATMCFQPIGVVYPAFGQPLAPTGWIVVRTRPGALKKVGGLALVDVAAPKKRFPLRVVRTHQRGVLETVILKPTRALPMGRSLRFSPSLHKALRLPEFHFEFVFTPEGKTRPPPKDSWVVATRRHRAPTRPAKVNATLVDSVDTRGLQFGIIGSYSRRRFALSPKVAHAALAKVTAGAVVEYVPLEADGSLALHWGSCFMTIPYKAGRSVVTAGLLDAHGRRLSRPTTISIALPKWR